MFYRLDKTTAVFGIRRRHLGVASHRLASIAWTVAIWGAATLAIGAEKPAAPAEPTRPQVRHLIEQLGDKDYFIRQQAEASLAKLGFEAFDALSDATNNEDLEISARARRLLQLMKVQWAGKDDSPEVRQLLRDYEMQNIESRQAKMNSLALMPDDAGVPALCRLLRYERSTLLSKQAAIKLLGSQKTAVPPGKELAEVVRKNLAGSRRPGAQWVLAWLRTGESPLAVTQDWKRSIEEEEAVLRSSPSQSSPEIVAALLRIQIAWLKKLGRTEDAVGAIGRLIELEKGDPETLANLLEWLIDQKDWKAVDTLAERFGPLVSAHASLLYFVAEARAAQGDTPRAEKTAQQALKLHPGKRNEDLIQHLVAGANLQQRGQFAWSKQEFRYVIATGPATSNITLTAQFRLSELMHDQAEELEAAEVLQQVLQAVGVNRPADAQVSDRTVGEVRSRMNYFIACHWEAKGDRAKHREFLDKALAAAPGDIDVLIACYRLSDATPDYHQKIRKLIAQAASDLREKINDVPDNPSNYNQFAWLIGNTEGNQDEAIRYSKKSLEMTPDAGGYYDTLAHVYFNKGDYENAVKQQARAAELDPHSGQIRKKLELFRKKLAEKKK